MNIEEDATNYCKDCKWFSGCKNIDEGICHRHAPYPKITKTCPEYWPSVGKGPWSLWPTVNGECDWCGEFEANEEVAK